MKCMIFTLFQKVDNEKRIETVNKMIAIHPTDGELYMKRRSVKIDLGDYEGSTKDLEIAASLGSKSAKGSLIYKEEKTTYEKISSPQLSRTCCPCAARLFVRSKFRCASIPCY